MSMSDATRKQGELGGIGVGPTLHLRAATVVLFSDLPWTILGFFLYSRLWALHGDDRLRLLSIYAPLGLAKTAFHAFVLTRPLIPVDDWLRTRPSSDEEFLFTAKKLFGFRDWFALIVAIDWALLSPVSSITMALMFPESMPPLSVVLLASTSLGLAQGISTWMQGETGSPAVTTEALALFSEEAERRGLKIPVRQIPYDTLLLLLAFAFALTPTFWLSSISYMIWYRSLVAGGAPAVDALYDDRLTLIGFVVLMILWVPPGAWFFSRGVVTPVKTVALAVRKVAEARSAAAAGRVPVYTLDEMGDLSDAVNSMVTRLAEADAQIREQVRELRALDELKDQFLRVAAHELKTPVTIIKGYSQLLLRRADTLPSDVTPLLGAMNRGTDRITQLVENFLSMTQLQTGRVPFVLTTFDLVELVKRVVTTTSGRAPDQPITIGGEPCVWVNGDRSRLERAVDALVSNAVKFSPDHGEIRVLVEKEGDEAVVKVKDHGIGIPVDKQSRIFESFFRAHTDTVYDSGGMGVGLYLARETLLRHNGAIGFVSQEGKGSHFVLRLPLSNAPPSIGPTAN